MFNHTTNFSGFGVGEIAWTGKFIPRKINLPNATAVRCSGDGKYVVACGDSAYLYVSSDYGKNWTQRGILSSWFGVSVSNSGQYMAAVGTGGTYISSDYGVTWVMRQSYSASSVAVSSSGQYVMSTRDGSYIDVSSDYGANFTQRGSALGWTACAISDDGSKMFATVNLTGIYVSTNFGVNWTKQSSVTSQWRGITASADGTIAYACSVLGYIYKSINSGTTWVAVTSAGNQYYEDIATSPDGSIVFAIQGNSGTGLLHKSVNYGVDWSITNYQNDDYRSVAMSDDSTHLYSVATTTVYSN